MAGALGLKLAGPRVATAASWLKTGTWATAGARPARPTFVRRCGLYLRACAIEALALALVAAVVAL